MVSNIQSSKYLNFIPFAEFDKWYVSYYTNPYSIKSKYKLEYLSNLIFPIKEKIKKNDYKGDLPVIAKISFADGKIHLRKENQTGMDLYKLGLNDLLVSKINFHQGAVAINKISDLVCSTHYQPYKIDDSKINPKYLVLVIRSNGFKDFLSFLRADGIKNEATYDFIGGLQIPLPSIEEQNRIVLDYDKKTQMAEQQEQQSKLLVKKIEKYLFDELGLEIDTESTKKTFGLKLIQFKNIERWAVDYLSKFSKMSFLFKGKYQPVKFKEIILGYQYGLSEKAEKENIGIPMLRMNNIFNSELELNNLKYIKKDSSLKKYILNKGDLLFNRTNSKELVGKTAIFDSNDEFTFASYLIRVVIDPNLANNNFINSLFNSTILQIQKDMVSRQITGQANINAQEMKEFLFPLPPLQKQKKISEHISSMKMKIKKLNSLSVENKQEAIKEFEEEIFIKDRLWKIN